jgi:hypothetical protein
MVVKMLMLLFLAVTPSGLVGRYQHFGGTFYIAYSPEDRSSIFLQKVGIYLQVHTALEPRSQH